jgi:hypothetical protein
MITKQLIKIQLLQLTTDPPNTTKTNLLNLDLILADKLNPEPELQLKLESQNNQWQDKTLTLQTSAKLTDRALEQVSLQTHLQDNILQTDKTLNNAQQTLN